MSSQGYGFPRAATSYLCQRFKVKKLFFLQINQKPCLSALCWDIGTAEDESSSSLSIGIKKVDHETLGVAHMALPADKKNWQRFAAFFGLGSGLSQLAACTGTRSMSPTTSESARRRKRRPGITRSLRVYYLKGRTKNAVFFSINAHCSFSFSIHFPYGLLTGHFFFYSLGKFRFFTNT